MEPKKLSELIDEKWILDASLDLDTSVVGVSQNSAQIKKSELFFAICGTQTDGHQFAAQAIASGALGAVVSDKRIFRTLPHAILVKDTAFCFGVSAHRLLGEPTLLSKEPHVKVIGVTGTNGKTTVTFLVHQLCQKIAVKSGLIGTVKTVLGTENETSSELTTPDAKTLAHHFSVMRENGLKYAAIEVSSIALDQWRVAGTHFDVSVFTNLTQDHLDYHGDMETYFDSKKRLFFHTDTKHSVLNFDDTFGRRLIKDLDSSVSFSVADPQADFYCSDVRYDRFGTQARLHWGKKTAHLRTPLLGKHNLENILAAVAALVTTGLNFEALVEAVKECPGAPGRLQRVAEAENHPAVFVDYAHTPDALENVLRILSALKKSQGGRLIGVFGCGGDRDRTKRPQMAAIASRLCDITIATSDNPRTEDPESILDDVEQGIINSETEYYRLCDRRQAIHQALKLAKPTDWVLIAGKGHENYQILGVTKFDFDDSKVVEQYYQ